MARWLPHDEHGPPGPKVALGWVHPKTGHVLQSTALSHARQASELGFSGDREATGWLASGLSAEVSNNAVKAGYTRYYTTRDEIGVHFNKDCPDAPKRAKETLAYHSQNQQGRMLLADTGVDYYHGTSLKDAHDFIDRVSTKLNKGRKETDYARMKRELGEALRLPPDPAARGPKDDKPQIDWHLKFPERAYISWFKVPEHQQGQGVGRAAYDKWEKSLPASVTHVELHAADSGNGPSDGFWQKMGFTHRYDYEEPPHPSSHEYEHSQLMHKGIRGHKTPETEFISADEMQESRADTLIRRALSESSESTKWIIFHGGRDFDQLDRRALGSGEPGNIRPLGRGFYGALSTGSHDVHSAIELAKIYGRKYGGKIHAFEVSPKPGDVNFGSWVHEPLLSDADHKWRALQDKANSLPVGPERRAAFDAADAHRKTIPKGKFSTASVYVAGQPAIEFHTEPHALGDMKRLGKWDVDHPTDDIAKSLYKTTESRADTMIRRALNEAAAR